MSKLLLKNVSKIYDNEISAVRDFNLEIKDKEFVIFVGPSGCGKSTTLRMIAGLEEISQGELWMDGKLINFIESKDRNLAMVFQNYALYPYMTVYDNLAFSLQIRNVPKKEIHKKVRETASLLQIEDLLWRKPNALSGGQKQRVAIGSAIIRQPNIFLMDEPLSNLDAKLRGQMRVELAKLHKELSTTIIYVTHDQTEAMTLGTKIVVMKDGMIQQIASPKILYENPRNLFVAGFIGTPTMNFIEAEVTTKNRRLYLEFNYKKIKLNDILNHTLYAKGYVNEKVIIGIRPNDIEIIADKEYKHADTFTIYPNRREILGAQANVYFDIGEKNYLVCVDTEDEIILNEAMQIRFNQEKLHLFDANTQENILYENKNTRSSK
ncbi:ABC transporter ATP-binding protein [Candidatus Galacturonibacter soehngenii]|uniref:sn-glycerol-3-phosphate ABC transporter ATP-binding protein UgpC n=1 Tax=Candidatus Galacturonatibacter soehngenii TaxID=2307010 RepID=A0A7V7UFI3_9FIRM|nr:sn-glycerol-3-phosphate ABC transporter ATP-binding protein UgpC [Candidatus Galacturonibacter soehngenii]KAB1437516.1 sn-glycerol-3-phosphate ABC transporter ATP-binding protein UgpC [Candidatus Galacturonibacter soehngenii]MBA4688454.1 sn-glycerol-3-phosphate ABC transporter ATP-binding protein UgpC [Candidatus Galacturonibacter soehngenii]